MISAYELGKLMSAKELVECLSGMKMKMNLNLDENFLKLEAYARKFYNDSLDGLPLLSSDEERYAFNGEKVQAIKMYRDRTGVSVIEAKDKIDRCCEQFRVWQESVTVKLF